MTNGIKSYHGKLKCFTNGQIKKLIIVIFYKTVSGVSSCLHRVGSNCLWNVRVHFCQFGLIKF